MTPTEGNYATTEKECLPVVWAVSLLRPYLEGIRFIIRTDHAPLRWLLNIAGTNAHGQLSRRRLRLAKLDCEVQYRTGISHHAADALSRLETTGGDTDPVENDLPTLVLESADPTPRFPILPVAEDGSNLRRGGPNCEGRDYVTGSPRGVHPGTAAGHMVSGVL